MAIHGYSGSGAPNTGLGVSHKTFSLGIFEVVPTASGKGTKRGGPIKVRVRGPMTNPQAVYDAAQKIVEQLDAGTYSGPKTVVLK